MSAQILWLDICIGKLFMARVFRDGCTTVESVSSARSICGQITPADTRWYRPTSRPEGINPTIAGFG